MATKTRSDLIEQALKVLGVLAAGQSAEAEDFDAVDDYIDSLLAELSARDLVTVDDPEAIDETVFLPVSILLAGEACQEFGLASLPTSPQNPDPIAAAEKRLREVLYARPTGEPQRSEYY